MESVQDRFLTLLVTQMRNQDPLNPMDNAEVTTQLAQISTVSGIDKLNNAIEGMAQGLLAAQSLQAGGLIGRGVLAPGSALVLEGGQAKAGVTPGQPGRPRGGRTSSAKRASGSPRSIWAPRPAGTLTFAWDGKTAAGASAPDGRLHLRGRGGPGRTQGRGGAASGFGRVQSVTLGAQDLQLNTYGLGSLGMSSVAQIL